MQWDNKFIKENKIIFDISIWETENLVWLNRFIIPKKLRKNGFGTKVMEMFSQWLDENQFDSKLLVSNCYGIPEHILINFYGKYGYLEKEIKNNSIFLFRRAKNKLTNG